MDAEKQEESPEGTDLYDEIARDFQLGSYVAKQMRAHQNLKHLQRERAFRIFQTLREQLGEPSNIRTFLWNLSDHPLVILTPEVLGRFTARLELLKTVVAPSIKTSEARLMIAQEPNILLAHFSIFMDLANQALHLIRESNARDEFMRQHPSFFRLDAKRVAQFVREHRAEPVPIPILWGELTKACSSPRGPEGIS